MVSDATGGEFVAKLRTTFPVEGTMNRHVIVLVFVPKRHLFADGDVVKFIFENVRFPIVVHTMMS